MSHLYNYALVVKMSGSESWPRKAELTHGHKNAMTTMSILQSLQMPLQNNLTALIDSLVNGLYKITTETIKLVLDVEQFGMNSNLIVLTPDVKKLSLFYIIFLFLCILIKTFHGFYMQKRYCVFFCLEFTTKSKTNTITLCTLFALPAAQV